MLGWSGLALLAFWKSGLIKPSIPEVSQLSLDKAATKLQMVPASQLEYQSHGSISLHWIPTENAKLPNAGAGIYRGVCGFGRIVRAGRVRVSCFAELHSNLGSCDWDSALVGEAEDWRCSG